MERTRSGVEPLMANALDRALGFLVARVGGRDGGLHHGLPWEFSAGDDRACS